MHIFCISLCCFTYFIFDQVEMEFVQSLGNPNYLHFLAQRGYMKDPCFVNYLKYLQYWQEPQYVKWVSFEALIKDFSTTYLRICNCRYLKYPVCLHFLELLQHETFRREIVRYEKSRTALWVYCFIQYFLWIGIFFRIRLFDANPDPDPIPSFTRVGYQNFFYCYSHQCKFLFCFIFLRFSSL